MDFYNQNQTVTPVARSLAAIMAAHEPQGLYVVEETQTNQIVAAGASCVHCDGRFVEVGGTIVRWKGYGLQRLLTQIRTIKSLAMTSGDVQLFCIVDTTQGDLKIRMRDLGFEDWTAPPQDLLEELAKQGHSGGDYMLFAGQRVEDHRQGLLAALRNPVIRHIGTGDVATIILDTLFTGDPDFRTALETAAPLPI